MYKESEQFSKTKQDLFDAFWSLYCEKKIEKITIKEITQKAGYNRSTFYEYFTDIYDVLEQLEHSLIPTLHELPPTNIANGSIGMSLDLFLMFYEQKSPYYSVLLGDNGDPAFASKLKQALKPLLKEMLNYQLTYSEIELDFMLEYVLSSMISMMVYYFKQDQLISLEQLISLMNEVMENGIVKFFNIPNQKNL